MILWKETNQVPEIPYKTVNGPIVSPETECLIICFILVSQVSLSQRNEDDNSVVDQTRQKLLHGSLDKSFLIDYKVSLEFIFINFLTFARVNYNDPGLLYFNIVISRFVYVY